MNRRLLLPVAVALPLAAFAAGCGASATSSADPAEEQVAAAEPLVLADRKPRPDPVARRAPPAVHRLRAGPDRRRRRPGLRRRLGRPERPHRHEQPRRRGRNRRRDRARERRARPGPRSRHRPGDRSRRHRGRPDGPPHGRVRDRAAACRRARARDRQPARLREHCHGRHRLGPPPQPRGKLRRTST